MVGDQETGLSVGDRLREGADLGRDHGSSQGPRLEDRETLGLEQARQGERRTGRQEGSFLPFGHNAEEPHAVFHPELAGSIPERVETARVGTRVHESNRCGQVGNGLEQIVDSFLLVKATEIQDEGRSAGLRGRPGRVPRIKRLLRERRRQNADSVRRHAMMREPVPICDGGNHDVAHASECRQADERVVPSSKHARPGVDVRHAHPVMERECEVPIAVLPDDAIVRTDCVSVKMDQLRGRKVRPKERSIVSPPRDRLVAPDLDSVDGVSWG